MFPAEVSDFTKIMEQWQNPGIDNTMKKSLPLKNCLVNFNNWHQLMLLFTTYLWGLLAHSATHTELYKDMGCNAIALLKLFIFIRLGWDIHSSGWEQGMRKMCPPHWRSSSKKKANCSFWKSTNIMLLWNTANPICWSPVLSNCLLTISVAGVTLSVKIFILSVLQTRFPQCTHFRSKPKICPETSSAPEA